MIDAMAELCAEQGYEATKIADVVRRAHVARKNALRQTSSGKEELFLGRLRTRPLADAESRGRRGLPTRSTRPSGRRAAAEAGLAAPLLEFGRRPTRTPPRLRAGRGTRRQPHFRPPATRWRLEGFIARLREAAPPGPGRPATLEEALVGGTVWIVQRQVPSGGPPRTAPDLLPELTEFVVFSVPECRKKVSQPPGGECDCTVSQSDDQMESLGRVGRHGLSPEFVARNQRDRLIAALILTPRRRRLSKKPRCQ